MESRGSLELITGASTASAHFVTEAIGSGSLIEGLLALQGDLTAVERFSRFHDHSTELSASKGRQYSALLPTAAPGPGQQLAFEVDLDRCSGCKACVAACHSLNGLDEHEVWREVGLVLGGSMDLPVIQHVTSACHHCLDPACLNVCPVNAYEKDPVTGIVKHLDDQCFGCQYCTLACPYDAPKFNPAKGIVRKCDMCGDRLEVGEAPACVQGCPTQAIRIRLVEQADVHAIAAADRFLPTAPDPNYTLPTTRYVSRSPLSGAVRPADHFRNAPEHVHTSLVAMLVLTQLSVGGFVIDSLLRAAGSHLGLAPVLRGGISLGFGLVGIAASILHLGRPQFAYRALIGLRHSWLSREVAAFGLFVIAYSVFVGLSIVQPGWSVARPSLITALELLAVATGCLGMFSSVMVYHVVQRPFWRARRSAPKFVASALVLGFATAVLSSACAGETIGAGLTLELTLAASIKLGTDASILLHLRDSRLSPLRRTALLLCGPLAKAALTRAALGLVGGVALPLAVAFVGESSSTGVRIALATLLFVALISGELLERVLFFAAVVRPKMPGGMMP